MKLILIILAIASAGEAQLGGGFGGGGAPAVPAGGAPAGPAGGAPAVPAGGGLGVPTGAPMLPAGADICSVFNQNPPNLPPDVIKGACTMAKNWLKGVQSAGPSPTLFRTILTPAQRDYWDSVVNCRSVQCICDHWPRCRQFTQEVSQGKRQANTSELLYYSQRYGTVTRKDIRAMDDAERHRFFYALNKIKYDKIDGWSKFDILTGYHFFIPFAPAAHFDAAVLPFHREVLKNLEVALRFEHPLASFPEWDTTLDAEMNNPRDTVLWTSELLGGGDGNVTGGPFGTWLGDPNSKFPAPLYQGGIFRAAGLSQQGILFNNVYVDLILAKPLVQLLVFCTDPFLDTVHAGVHLYIGGLMADPTSSPGEPLFYMLHAFVDSIWERWRQKHQDRKLRETQIPLPCPYQPFDLPDAPLLPFPIKVKDAYANVYTDEFYTYQAPATCANKCYGSKYLTCKPNGKCMSKARIGGDCSGLTGVADPCYKGKCQDGKCVAE